MSEPFDIQTKKFTCRSTWTISRLSLMVKVKGQGHQVRKYDFSCYSDPFMSWMEWYKIMAYGMMSGRHVTSQHDVTPSCDITKWRHMGRRTLKCPTLVCERSGVFIKNQCQTFSDKLVKINILKKCHPWKLCTCHRPSFEAILLPKYKNKQLIQWIVLQA